MRQSRFWSWLLAMTVVSGAVAVPVDFTGKAITCIDPPGATVPVPCALTTVARPDGYALVGYSFNFLIPPPVFPPPPFPAVVKNDSMRDFINPVMQDLFLRIFGDTVVDVFGAPVLFFVSGTLDGVVISSFAQVVGGLGNAMSWDVTNAVMGVSAGLHTLDMHFGIIQQFPNQQSQVNISSQYNVTLQEVPEPVSSALVLVALGMAGLARQRGPGAATPSTRRQWPKFSGTSA